jgi:uncharacterized protein YceH (UPF0502 family)
LYEWLGVDKVELAVMAELLLRGEQTVGELRSRASRMEPIPDLGALRTILQSLKAKRLLLELTPEGRGQIVSHNLYKDRELADVSARVASGAAAAPADMATDSRNNEPSEPPSRSQIPGVTRDMFNELSLEVAELRAEVARLRDELRARGQAGANAEE